MPNSEKSKANEDRVQIGEWVTEEDSTRDNSEKVRIKVFIPRPKTEEKSN